MINLKALLKSKKGVEWYIFVTLILMVLSIIIIALFYSGAFPKIGAALENALFGPPG